MSAAVGWEKCCGCFGYLWQAVGGPSAGAGRGALLRAGAGEVERGGAGLGGSRISAALVSGSDSSLARDWPGRVGPRQRPLPLGRSGLAGPVGPVGQRAWCCAVHPCRLLSARLPMRMREPWSRGGSRWYATGSTIPVLHTDRRLLRCEGCGPRRCGTPRCRKSGFCFLPMEPRRRVCSTGWRRWRQVAGGVGGRIRISATFAGGVAAGLEERFAAEVGRINAAADQSLLVDTCGYVSGKQKARCYTEADLLLVPSRWESFGLTVIEAMAWGLPVVATASDGVRGVLSDDYEWLAPPGDRGAWPLRWRRRCWPCPGARGRCVEIVCARSLWNVFAASVFGPESGGFLRIIVAITTWAIDVFRKIDPLAGWFVRQPSCR